MAEPKVSIIIPFYNCEYIAQSISSAVNQTYLNKEVIVVNDGSDRHIEKISPFRDRIIYLEKENGGTASAVNMGIQHSTGEYFSWLSSDDLFNLRKTELQMAFMKKVNASASYTNFHIINNQSDITQLSAGKTILDKKAFYSYLRTSCHINGCTVIMKSSLFKKTGLFNEKLLYTQDYDMWLRVLHHEEFHFLNAPLVLHRLHENMGTIKHLNELWEEFAEVRKRYDSFLLNKLN
ncbi:glycosyltransferase [Bacillus infantis]|uniref:Glycosyltransferase n=1 Tax=Bacillus infantis TaxID=324767 RepID=A0A5D4R9J5_9BACI|nr:glycosyltransferase [Bacillus infantis]TYS48017.1 glycosyltransferase [Bacillus infantis]